MKKNAVSGLKLTFVVIAVIVLPSFYALVMVKAQLIDPSEWTKLSPTGPSRIYQPTWSPDATEIVYAGGPNLNLWKMNADGTNIRQLDTVSECDHPDVSPDGSRIAFYRMYRLAIMNYDGTGWHYITPSSEEWHAPSWSPDGNRIVAQKGGSHPQIFVINSDGTNPVQLTFPGQSGSWGNYYPCWSPDGTKIVYQGRDAPQEPKNYDIWVMDSNGQNQRRLTNDGRSYAPKWSPDGSKIIFARADLGQDINAPELGHIFIINADGTNVTQLTDSNGWESLPEISPDGLWVVFDHRVRADGNHIMYKMRMPAFATINIDPDTLNLKSNGKFVTAYIELPEGYDVADIALFTVQLEGIPAITDPQYGFVTDPTSYIIDHDGDGILERIVKFDRATVRDALTGIIDYEEGVKFYDLTLTVKGEVAGTPFEGSDTITVIKK